MRLSRARRHGFSATNVLGKKLFSNATSLKLRTLAQQAYDQRPALRASLYYGSASPMNSPGRPVYLRLRDEICVGILEGRYPEGTMLPSVRTFAAEQGANPLTVAKAYQQFQDEGFVTVQRGIGMFVAAGAVEALRKRERESFLTNEWPTIALRMHLLGLKLVDLTELA